MGTVIMTGVGAKGGNPICRASWQHPSTREMHLPFDLAILSSGIYCADAQRREKMMSVQGH